MDINDGTVKQTLSGHTGYVNDFIAFDINCLISASHDSTIKIWNINEGKVLRTLRYDGCVLALKLINNNELASSSTDKNIQIRNIENGKLIRLLAGHTSGVWGLVLLPNGDLISGSFDKTIKIWDLNSGLVKRTLQGHASIVNRLGSL